KVDGWRRQSDIERHIVVGWGERLQISPDLVADIAARGDRVGADDDQVNEPMLHEMTAGIVGNHGMRHAMLAELPSGQGGALIARPRLVGEDVDGNAVIV